MKLTIKGELVIYATLGEDGNHYQVELHFGADMQLKLRQGKTILIDTPLTSNSDPLAILKEKGYNISYD